MPLFKTTALINCSAISLRNFLGQPANLPDISDPDIELEIVQAPSVIQVGEKIIFRVTAMGLRQRMTHEYLTASESEIVESLVEGPLPLWRHRQHLEALPDNQCQLTDEVEFQTPGGLLRFMLTEQRIRESLEAGMAFRYQALAQRTASGVLQ